jgi:hypothetical protein
MALKKSEKVLSISAGILLVPAAILGLMQVFGGSGANLRAQRTNLAKEVEEKREKVQRGIALQDRLAEWNRRALPADVDVARSKYQNWLTDLSNRIGFEDRTVNPGSGRSVPGVYNRVSFIVSGQGTLKQLTQWLFEFYSAGHLQQIRSLTVTPVAASDRFDLTIAVDALSLPGAVDEAGQERRDLLVTEPSGRLADKLEAFTASIVQRNVFRPYSPPPPPAPPRVEAPPPPPPPAFDHGRFTEITGIVEVNGRPQVWIFTRTTGKLLKLFEGDSFEVGATRGRIVHISIDPRNVESEVDGKRYLVAFGDTMADALELPE